MKQMTRPFSLGHNGHAKCCDCERCSATRADALIRSWREYGSKAVVEPSKTVFVRAYWRKQKNHFNKMPNTRRRLKTLLTALRTDQRAA